MFAFGEFDAAGEICFDANNTLNMEEVNEKPARINIVFLVEHPELKLEPTDWIELRQLLNELQ